MSVFTLFIFPLKKRKLIVEFVYWVCHSSAVRKFSLFLQIASTIYASQFLVAFLLLVVVVVFSLCVCVVWIWFLLVLGFLCSECYYLGRGFRLYRVMCWLWEKLLIRKWMDCVDALLLGSEAVLVKWPVMVTQKPQHQLVFFIWLMC